MTPWHGSVIVTPEEAAAEAAEAAGLPSPFTVSTRHPHDSSTAVVGAARPKP
jgi:hypothetical protein